MKKKLVTQFTADFNVLTALTFVLLCTLSACQEEEVIDAQNEVKAIEQSGWSIRLNSDGNYLEFENYEVFQETINLLKDMSYKEIETWSNGYNFTSLSMIYKRAIFEQQAYIEDLEEKVKAGRLSVEDVTEKHAPFVRRYARSFIFSQEIETDFDMNIFSPAIANVVNEIGVVKIGKTLSQYTNQVVKVMTGGISNQLNVSTLINAQDDNPDLGIKINAVTTDQDKLQSANQRSIYFNQSCTDQLSGSAFCRGTRIASNVKLYRYEDASGQSRLTGVATTKHYFDGIFGWNLNIEASGYVRASGRAVLYERICQNSACTNWDIWDTEVHYDQIGEDGDPSLSYTFYDGRGEQIEKNVFRHSANSGTSAGSFCNVPLFCWIDIFNWLCCNESFFSSGY